MRRFSLVSPQNAFIESFNGKFRDECLNEHWFCSLAGKRESASRLAADYSEHRPHSAIGNLARQRFANWRTRQQQLKQEKN